MLFSSFHSAAKPRGYGWTKIMRKRTSIYSSTVQD